MWLDRDAIFKLDFWDKVSRLLFLYLMFLAVFINIDKLFKYGPLVELQNEVWENFFDFDAHLKIFDHIYREWYFQSIILNDIPGKDCS